jgi:hypothetical protein
LLLVQTDRTTPMTWSVMVPTIIGPTISMWAQKANIHIRQHATACCTGDFCVGTATEMNEPTIPEEISFQKCKTDCSVSASTSAGMQHHPSSFNKHDVELTTFEASSIVAGDSPKSINDEYDTAWTVLYPIRRTKWNEVPYDPVDELSLKGSSMYMSASSSSSSEHQQEQSDTILDDEDDDKGIIEYNRATPPHISKRKSQSINRRWK